MFRSSALTVTAVAAVLAGAALFAIAARGARAVAIHLQSGTINPALMVGFLSALCFGASLGFLMPAWLRRIIRAGEQPEYRMPVTFAAIVVLFTILIAAAMTDRASGARILGLVPHAALWPATFSFAALFTLAFILPGLAYRTDPAARSELPKVPQPAPKLAWSANSIRSPLLRRVIQALVLGYIALVALAFYAWAFASVLPDPAIIAANRKYLALSILLPTLAFAIPLWRAPITGDAQGREAHMRAKAPVILGLLLFNGMMAVNLPERALPIVANRVLGAEENSREVTVVKAKPRSGLRGCGALIVVLLDPQTGRHYDLCHMPRELAEKARPGDRLILHGRTAGYGLVLESATLVPRPRGTAQPSSRQRLTIG